MVNLNNQVIRQLTKIKRIITQLSQQNPKITQKLDKILYGVIKVEKIVKKMQNKQQEIYINIDDIDNEQIRQDGDDIFRQANQMVQKFKRTTYKFQKKMNIFLNQTYFKNKIKQVQALRKHQNKKSKKNKWSPQIEEDDQSFKQINAEIAQIVEQLIWQNQKKQSHDNQ